MIMKEELIRKWLNNELTEQELESFKNTDDYISYSKILDKAKHFKAPDFNDKSSYNAIEEAISQKQKNSNKIIYQLVSSIAAVLIIGFLIIRYAYSELDPNSVETSIAKTETINLPDHSQVSLNANSSIDYDSQNWKNERALKLSGEALFEVEKGEKFTVNTDYGSVEVLGTVFNVKSRSYTFEVHCFEGSVKVTYGQDSYILQQNDFLTTFEGKIKIEKKTITKPDWKSKISVFQSQPLHQVLKEFENYYNVKFDSSRVDSGKIFTGSFSHENLEIALNSITLPLGLSYKIDGETVFLSYK
jgi:ferric-dicitrate binding protein FerR (iron transport regulator)